MANVDMNTLAQDIEARRQRPPAPMRSNPAIALGEPTGPIDSAIGPVAAKHRELVDAAGDIPNRTMIAFRDAARRTSSVAEWERFEKALYALIGDPE